MSRTTVLKLWPRTTINAEHLMELPNSWGFAIPVWQALSEGYCDRKFLISENLEYLWKLHSQADIPLAHRAVLCMTFDNAYVSRKDYGQAADHIREYLRDYPPKTGNVDHWDNSHDHRGT